MPKGKHRASREAVLRKVRAHGLLARIIYVYLCLSSNPPKATIGCTPPALATPQMPN